MIATNTQTKKTAQQWAAEIAGHMEGWDVVRVSEDRFSTHYATLRHEDGRAFTIYTHYMSNKPPTLAISGEYPRTKDNESTVDSVARYSEHPRIGVSANRTAIAIAKDISHRFLPAYGVLYGKCLEKKRTAEAAEDSRHALLCRMAKALGQKLPARLKDRIEWWGPEHGGGRGTLCYHYDGKLSLSLSDLTEDTTARILQLVRRQWLAQAAKQQPSAT